jgi:adenylate kinase family enzyme
MPRKPDKSRTDHHREHCIRESWYALCQSLRRSRQESGQPLAVSHCSCRDYALLIAGFQAGERMRNLNRQSFRQVGVRAGDTCGRLPGRSCGEAVRVYASKVKRALILGRGGSGKSTLAVKLGEITGLPLIELDKIFWQRGLHALPPDEWVKMQRRLVAQDSWIMDGDLGQYDAVEIRLPAADTIILLDFALVRCAWRAARRGRECGDFWRWLIAYRLRSLPVLMRAIGKFAPHAELHLIRNPRELQRFLAGVEAKSRKAQLGS